MSLDLTTVNILHALTSGKVCHRCWNIVDPQNPAADLILSIYYAQRSENQLSRVDNPAKGVLFAADILHSLNASAHSDTHTWTSRIREEATQVYTQSHPQATNAAAKADARKLSGVTPGGEERLLALRGEDLTKLHHTTGAVAYHLTAKGGCHLLQAPLNIVAVAEYQQCIAFDNGLRVYTSNLQVTPACSDPDLLERVIEMWNPNDSLFGDLEKLVEAAGLLR